MIIKKIKFSKILQNYRDKRPNSSDYIPIKKTSFIQKSKFKFRFKKKQHKKIVIKNQSKYKNLFKLFFKRKQNYIIFYNKFNLLQNNINKKITKKKLKFKLQLRSFLQKRKRFNYLKNKIKYFKLKKNLKYFIFKNNIKLKKLNCFKVKKKYFISKT